MNYFVFSSFLLVTYPIPGKFENTSCGIFIQVIIIETKCQVKAELIDQSCNSDNTPCQFRSKTEK